MRGRLVLEKRHMTQAVCMERSPRIEFINKTRNEIWCFLRQSRALKSQSSTPGSRGSTGGDWALPLPSHPPPPSAPSSVPIIRAWVSRTDTVVFTRQGIESMQTWITTWLDQRRPHWLQPGHLSPTFSSSTIPPIHALISGVLFRRAKIAHTAFYRY